MMSWYVTLSPCITQNTPRDRSITNLAAKMVKSSQADAIAHGVAKKQV